VQVEAGSDGLVDARGPPWRYAGKLNGEGASSEAFIRRGHGPPRAETIERTMDRPPLSCKLPNPRSYDHRRQAQAHQRIS
jgi:hypothetical protein